MNLSDRIRRLELGVVMSAVNALTDRESKQLARWPELVLERYCEGRLDGLAATLEPVTRLLNTLSRDGYAVEIAGCWHPLFAVGDTALDARVLDRLSGVQQETLQ